MGRVQTFIGHMFQRAELNFWLLVIFDEFSSSRCTLVPSRDLDQSQNDFIGLKMQPCGLFHLHSFALLLSSCPSFFRDLWSCRALTSLRNLSFGSRYTGRGRIGDTKQKGRSSSSSSRAGACQSCQSNDLYSRSRNVNCNIKPLSGPDSGLVLHLKVSRRTKPLDD